MIKVSLRPHTKRERALKAFITLTCLSGLLIHPVIAGPLSLIGNMVWLWFDFD